ncbi:MAG: HlyD family efflux transporter periplasmic adaptor subunit [Alloprevotella sp.]|nr:HlyD family efflux transporter periplasmic adaptor subunit [Alloprevotella sp.]
MLVSGLAVTSLLCACTDKEKDYDATGVFEATEVTVSAQSSGELTLFNITEGTLVEAGAHVGSIDAEHLSLQKQQLGTTSEQLNANRRQLESTRAATESQRLDLEKQSAVLQQQISNAQRERKRYAELVSDGAVARKQLDDIDYQISVLQKQLAATRDQLSRTNRSLQEQAQALQAQVEGIQAQQRGLGVQQEQLDDQIRHTRIVTPLRGTVLEKYAEQGEFVSTGKPLFKLADTENMFLRAYITSAQLQSVKVGQAVTVFADYGGGQRKEYAGTVSWISQKSEFTPKTILTDDERADLVYAVKIAVKNDGGIKIGMYGEVKFSLTPNPSPTGEGSR